MLKSFINLLLPAQCLQCQGHVQESGTLCHICWNKISFISQPCCHICSFPFDYMVDETSLCAECIASTPIYDKASSVMLYDKHSAKLITRLKYGDKTQGARTYGAWMSKHAKHHLPADDIDFVVPVPIHKKRLIQRSYNQSALIAKFIATDLHIPFAPSMLKRCKHTPPQASLNKTQRHKNVKGCFAINNKYATVVDGKNILLVDDVVTTGATLQECAKQLKKAGAQHVYVSTLAKTIK